MHLNKQFVLNLLCKMDFKHFKHKMFQQTSYFFTYYDNYY